MTYIIALVAQKGGVGKSTIARSIAREVSKHDMSVKLIDLDVKQGTTKEWHDRRLANGYGPVAETVDVYDSLGEAFADIDDYDMIILDCPGDSSSLTLEVAQHADIVIQPSCDSIDDLNPAIRLFHELTAGEIPHEKLYMAMFKMSSRARELWARDYVNQSGYKILDGYVYDQGSYRMTLDAGKALTETNYGSLGGRVDELIQSIFDNLNN